MMGNNQSRFERIMTFRCEVLKWTNAYFTYFSLYNSARVVAVIHVGSIQAVQITFRYKSVVFLVPIILTFHIIVVDKRYHLSFEFDA